MPCLVLGMMMINVKHHMLVPNVGARHQSGGERASGQERGEALGVCVLARVHGVAVAFNHLEADQHRLTHEPPRRAEVKPQRLLPTGRGRFTVRRPAPCVPATPAHPPQVRSACIDRRGLAALPPAISI